MKPPRRPSARWRWWRWWMVVAWAWLLAGCELDEPRGPGVIRLDRGEILLAGPNLPQQPPPADAAWRPMALPDAWDAHRPDYMGYAWYRLPVPPAVHLAPELAIYLPSVSMNAAVWVNGHPLGGQGRMDEPVARHFYTPLLFPLPRALLQPAGQANEVHVLLMGYRSYRSGLAPVYLGDSATLRSAWSTRGFWQNTGTLITSVLVLGIGAYGALLWSRSRGNPMYAWFTLGTLVWGLRNLNFVLTDNPWDNRWWNQFSLIGALIFVGLFALFTLDYSRWLQGAARLPRWQRAVPLTYIAMGALMLLTPGDTAALRRLFIPLGFGGLLLTLWSQWHLLRAAWRVGGVAVWSVTLAGLAYLGFMCNDLLVAIDRLNLGQLFVRQYAAVPLFVAVTVVWTEHYWQALRDAKHLSRNLRQQVDEQRLLIEENYRRLMASERERVLSQERERLVGDLHDGLGLHLLTALRIARGDDRDPALLAETIQDCLDDLRLAIDSMSNLDERDPVLVLASLRFRLAPRLKAAGVLLEWEVDPAIAPQSWLDAPRALHLLRLVQEAISNAVRHGRATRVRLQLSAAGGGIIVSVIDNGCGFDPSAASAGHGLEGMHRRAQAMQARLDILRRDEGGMEVRLTRLMGPDAEVTGDLEGAPP